MAICVKAGDDGVAPQGAGAGRQVAHVFEAELQSEDALRLARCSPTMETMIEFLKVLRMDLKVTVFRQVDELELLQGTQGADPASLGHLRKVGRPSIKDHSITCVVLADGEETIAQPRPNLVFPEQAQPA